MLCGEQRLERRSVWHPADLCISTQEGEERIAKSRRVFNVSITIKCLKVVPSVKASLNSGLWQREDQVARGEERHAISSGPKGNGVTLEEGASGKKSRFHR